MEAGVKTETPSVTKQDKGHFKRVWESVSIIFASKTGMIGLAIVLFWVLVAIFAPFLSTYTPLEQD